MTISFWVFLPNMFTLFLAQFSFCFAVTFCQTIFIFAQNCQCSHPMKYRSLPSCCALHVWWIVNWWGIHGDTNQPNYVPTLSENWFRERYFDSYWITCFQLDTLVFWWIVTWTRVSKLSGDLLCFMFLKVLMVFAKVVWYHPFYLQFRLIHRKWTCYLLKQDIG